MFVAGGEMGGRRRCGVFKQKQVRHSNRKLLIHDRYVVAPFYKKCCVGFNLLKWL